MTKCNSVSLTGSCGNSTCGWYDDWCCGNSCSDWCGCSTNGCGCINGCQTGSCANGCGSSCGCANGCQTGGCVNACGCTGAWQNCGCNCNNCGGCSSCSSLWPDAPALQNGGVLIPRIIGSGRLCQRISDVTLCMQDIPDCAKPPFALLSVTASGPSDWEFVSVQRWRAVLRVTIPLIGQIRDCDGCVFNVHSSITVDVPIRITIPTADLGRAHVAIQPGVRLICAGACSDDGCFNVSLAVLVDAYIARWEASSDGETIPCRPDLPLTLPATFHPGCGCGWNSCCCSNRCR